MGKGSIYIVGYMGAGKSSGGRRLARTMNVPFVDTDEALMASSGMEVSEIFSAHGELGFRKMERQVLRALSSFDGTRVIATGGGTPCFEDNMAYMLSHGTVVYFKVAPSSLIPRLMAKRKNRPLLEPISEEDLPGFIQQHLEEREAHYKQAHITVDADALDGARLDLVSQMIAQHGAFNP